nr:MAG TPA: hypothetical protein [Caudoviricetes sp.]
MFGSHSNSLIFFKFSPELEKIRHCRCRNTTLSN